jgi:hypothetical protein
MNDLPTKQNAANASGEANEPPKPPRLNNVSATNPESQRQRSKSNLWRKLHKAPVWIEAACAIALVVITGFYTHYAHRTLEEIIKQYPEITKSANAAKSAADTASSALVSVQRAFVTYDETDVDSYPTSIRPTNQEAWAFTAKLENSGTTPAVSAIREFAVNNTLRAEPTDLEFLGPNINQPIGEIGPRGTTMMGPIVKPNEFVMGNYPFTPASVTSQEFQKFFNSRKVFVWGWVGYRDVFPNTAPHVTEFCKLIKTVGIELSNGTAPSLTRFVPTVILESCVKHNCTDESCKDYPNIAAKVPK